MLPYFTEQWGNPSSVYRFASEPTRAIESSRAQIAEALGANSAELIFTGSATESINSAIHSAKMRFPRKKHIVTSAVEHSATLAYCEHLERDYGFDVTRISVDKNGMLIVDELSAAIRDDTVLVSLIWANNETGVVWPIKELAAICRERGVLLHVDGVQAVGKIPVDFSSIAADFLSFSGHKLGCPKGVGGLLVAEPDKFVPLIFGGKQEDGHRGGTENVAFIAGLSKAIELRTSSAAKEGWRKVRELRENFEAQLLKHLPTAVVNGVGVDRLPNTVSLFLPGIDSDAAVTYMDQKGICVSSGSACLESAIAPSHVIYAMTQSHEIASETLRISLGLDSTEAELKQLTKELVSLVEVYA